MIKLFVYIKHGLIVEGVLYRTFRILNRMGTYQPNGGQVLRNTLFSPLKNSQRHNGNIFVADMIIPELGMINHFQAEIIWEEMLGRAKEKGQRGPIKIILEYKSNAPGQEWQQVYK